MCRCVSTWIFDVQGRGVTVVLEGISSIESSCPKIDEEPGLWLWYSRECLHKHWVCFGAQAGVSMSHSDPSPDPQSVGK